MAADDLMREYDAAVLAIWGSIVSERRLVQRVIQSELPSPDQISKAGKGRPAGIPHAPGPNWANGDLKESFGYSGKEFVGRTPGGSRIFRLTFESDKDYVYYYANGNYHPSYHGYDFIQAAKNRLPSGPLGVKWD